MKHTTHLKKGFTLIELLVVVLIIGILAAIALPQYQSSVLKSRYTQLQTAVHSLKNAQEIYYLENGEYASEMDELPVSFSNMTENTTNDWVAPDGLSCKIDGDGAAVSCSLFYGFSYLVGLDHGIYASQRFCYAPTDNTSANAVCRSLGGTENGGWEGVNRYLLP